MIFHRIKINDDKNSFTPRRKGKEKPKLAKKQSILCELVLFIFCALA
jgi:hypothetical protein